MTEQSEQNTQPPFSDLPRFTLAGLREIVIPAGETDSTLAKYTFRRKGKRIEKFAKMDDLTEQEKAAALAFILAHGQGVRIRRKDTPPCYEELPALELPDDLTEGETRTDTPAANGTTEGEK